MKCPHCSGNLYAESQEDRTTDIVCVVCGHRQYERNPEPWAKEPPRRKGAA